MKNYFLLLVSAWALCLLLENRAYAQNNVFPPSGNVGLGTTTPQYLLDVNGWMGISGIDIRGMGYFGKGSSVTGAWNLPEALTLTYYKRDFAIGGWGKTNSTWQGASLFINSDNGYVGINNIAPRYRLDVEGWMGTSGMDIGGIGYFGKGSSVTGAWNLPEALTLTYYKRDFAIGGWGKTNSTWQGASLFINSDNGNVGIGTTNPTQKLEIQGNIKINSLSKSAPQYLLFNNRDINSAHGDTYHLGGMIASAWRDVADPSNVASIIFERKSAVGGLSSAGEIVFGTTMNGGNNIPQERMRIDYNGNVSIGTNNSFGYKLAVNGTIGAKEINLETTNFPDYVFDNNYPLPSLQEVEKYINAQHHLPNIPSAKEANQKGVSVGELQNKLLEKIEELTLYIIQQQKQMAQQQQRIEALENRK